jgi:hypothetical protein
LDQVGCPGVHDDTGEFQGPGSIQTQGARLPGQRLGDRGGAVQGEIGGDQLSALPLHGLLDAIREEADPCDGSHCQQ